MPERVVRTLLEETVAQLPRRSGGLFREELQFLSPSVLEAAVPGRVVDLRVLFGQETAFRPQADQAAPSQVTAPTVLRVLSLVRRWFTDRVEGRAITVVRPGLEVLGRDLAQQESKAIAVGVEMGLQIVEVVAAAVQFVNTTDSQARQPQVLAVRV